MSTPGGGRHTLESTPATSSVLGAPDSLMRRSSHGAQVTGLWPFALPSQKGGAPNLRSPFPLLGGIKAHPSVNKSSIWGTKKSPILGMCSDPPRYYNLIRRQAGRRSSLSEVTWTDF